MPIPTEIIDLSAGYQSTCAVLADHTAKCWGRNNAGQLGDGMGAPGAESAKPVAVMGLSTVDQISVGYEHACAKLSDGTARCWGTNSNGQLGNNSKMSSTVPVTVMGLSGVASVHAGVYISCAVLTGGGVACWGRGGHLGDNGFTESLVPRTVPGLTNVKQLSVAPNAGAATPIHVCGVRNDGTAFCWGSGTDGALANGSFNDARAPTPVLGAGDAGVTDAQEVTVGGTHGCVRRTSGLMCWGFGTYLGDGVGNRQWVATPVTGNPSVTAIEAGNDHTLARTPANGLICWGRNGRGACGDGATFTPGGPVYLSPVPAMLTGVSLFSAGGDHTCAYQSGPKVTWCWGGTDWGQLGYEVELGVSRLSTPDFVRW